MTGARKRNTGELREKRAGEERREEKERAEKRRG